MSLAAQSIICRRFGLFSCCNELMRVAVGSFIIRMLGLQQEKQTISDLNCLHTIRSERKSSEDRRRGRFLPICQAVFIFIIQRMHHYLNQSAYKLILEASNKQGFLWRVDSEWS